MMTKTEISKGQLVAGLMDLYREVLVDDELAAVATECAIEELLASHARATRRQTIANLARAHAMSAWPMARAA